MTSPSRARPGSDERSTFGVFSSLKNRGALVSRLASCFVHTEKRENFQLKDFFHLLVINFSCFFCRSELIAGQCQRRLFSVIKFIAVPSIRSIFLALMIYRKQKKIVFNAFQPSI
jgi:hypothetical protein